MRKEGGLTLSLTTLKGPIEVGTRGDQVSRRRFMICGNDETKTVTLCNTQLCIHQYHGKRNHLLDQLLDSLPPATLLGQLPLSDNERTQPPSHSAFPLTSIYTFARLSITWRASTSVFSLDRRCSGVHSVVPSACVCRSLRRRC